MNKIEIAMSALGITMLQRSAEKTFTEELPNMSIEQKLGVLAAGALTFVRPMYYASQLLSNKKTERAWVADTCMDIGLSLTDGLDGLTARKMDATTSLGAVLDQQVGDKYAFWLKEADMVRRGKIHPGWVALRFVRDLAITEVREQIDVASAGGVNISPLAARSIFSGKNSTTNRLVTNTLLDSPLAERMPKPTKEIIAAQATAHLAVSGGFCVESYLRAYNEWQQKQAT